MLDTKLDFTKTEVVRITEITCAQLGIKLDDTKFIHEVITWWENNPDLLNDCKTAPVPTRAPSSGIELIAQERQKQIEKHGFTGEHHARHPEWYAHGQLLSAAHMLAQYDEEGDLSYLYRKIVPLNWDKEWWQRLCDKPKRERIIISASLLAAEIDRLNFDDVPSFVEENILT